MENMSQRLQCLRTVGYLTVALPARAVATIEQAFASAYAFFRLDAEGKSLCRLKFDCGYRPVGVEYSLSPDSPDAIESFTACFRTALDASDLPQPAASLHKDMISAMRELELLIEELVVEAAETIDGTPSRSRLAGSLRLWSRAQINYSRPSHTKASFINDVHEDGHVFTLTCATAPGLEVKTKEGDFINVFATPSNPVIFAGEIAYLLSGGCFDPLYHRVKPSPDHDERLSLQYFCDIDPAVSQPWARSDVNRDIDIGARIRSNPTRFGLLALPEV
jgi:isopenicillin N synthase-like dioxygenase